MTALNPKDAIGRAKLPLQTILREILATLQTSTASDTFFSAYANDVKGMTDAIRKARELGIVP